GKDELAGVDAEARDARRLEDALSEREWQSHDAEIGAAAHHEAIFEIDLARHAHGARKLEDRGLDARLLGERAIEMDRRARQTAEARPFDAPAVGEVGFERIERAGDRKD